MASRSQLCLAAFRFRLGFRHGLTVSGALGRCSSRRAIDPALLYFLAFPQAEIDLLRFELFQMTNRANKMTEVAGR